MLAAKQNPFCKKGLAKNRHQEERMKILLFGVSNVGKTTIGKLLSGRIGFDYFDLDDEVKSRLGMTLEQFVNTADLRWRDQKRGNIIKKILKLDENIVFSISPISYTDNFQKQLIDDDILMIELYDTPENIFSRLVFSDEDDNIYSDDLYKNQYKDHYLREGRGKSHQDRQNL